MKYRIRPALPDDGSFHKWAPVRDPDEIGQQVQTAVVSLPEKLRVVITLKDLEGYSYEDVSSIIQCKLGTVKSRHARGREQLRQPLAATCPVCRSETFYEL